MIQYLFRYRQALLITGDVLLYYISLSLTLLLRYKGNLTDQTREAHFITFTFLIPITLLLFFIYNLYKIQNNERVGAMIMALLKTLLLNLLLFIGIFYFLPSSIIGITPKTNLFIFSFIFGLLMGIWRYGINSILTSPNIHKRMLIIGDTDTEQKMAFEVTNHPEYGYRIIEMVPTNDAHSLETHLQSDSIQTVILGPAIHTAPEIISLLYRFNNRAVEYMPMGSFYEQIIRKVPPFSMSEMWCLQHLREQKMLYDILKRGIDLVMAIVGGGVFILLFLPIALAIIIETGTPVLYHQKRVGKHGKPFILYKFRTMLQENGITTQVWAEINDTRVTRVGKFLRRTRLDELPQLINVLKNEMSFIGPRPEQLEIHAALARDIPFYHARTLVKSCLIVWEQTMKRYAGTIDESLEKLLYDLYYIKNRSLSLDIEIIIRTTRTIFQHEGR